VAAAESRAGKPPRQGMRVRYADDGRMFISTFGGEEIDAQAAYGYA
jgi:hypothetical protein